jgi:hypothetical protein
MKTVGGKSTKEKGDGNMTTGIHEQATKETTESATGQISERRLWAAVLLQALEDWQSGNIRRQREAEKFFFSSEKDFATVCRGAGYEPSCVLLKLQRMKPVGQQSFKAPAWSWNLNQPVAEAA